MSNNVYFHKYFNIKSSQNKSWQIPLFFAILCILLLQPAVTVFAGSSSTFRNQYSFIPEESSLIVYRTDGYTIIEQIDNIVVGKFDFFGNSNKGYFTDSNAVILDADTYVAIDELSDVFNLFEINGSFTDNSIVSFTGKASFDNS